MKKFYLLLIFLTFATMSIYAQSERMVLIEEATNASCGPCASQNPAFDVLLNQNRDILTAIKYHWYFPGYDPMHNQNPVENDNRVAFYGINGVPTATIDGDIPDGPTFSYPGGPHGYTQQLIDDYAAVPSPFNLYISHHFSDDQDTIFVDMMIEATEDVTGNMVAQMVVVEKHIYFSSPPGSNGETTFLDVMRKMIPDENGTPIPNSFQAGDYIILQGSWALQNIYDMDEVGVVGFVQNMTTKDVLQAGNSTTDPLTPLYNDDVSMASVSDVSETNCLGTITPKVTIRNNGADPLTSLQIHYRVNDDSTYTYSWEGNLDFLESSTVSLPQISFDLLDENDFYAYSDDPNGVPDEFTRNDTIVQPFEHAAITPLTVKLMIRTDNNPQETTWEVVNSSGEVQYSGGPYSNSGTVYQETFQLADVECYIFRIFDSGGDGLQIPGFYALYYGSGTYIKNGTDFGSVDSAYFEVNTTVGVPEMARSTDIKLYPNPATDRADLGYFLPDPAGVKWSVYDLTGKLIREKDLGMLPAGPHITRVNTGSMNAGIYFVRITVDGKVQTKKLSIIK